MIVDVELVLVWLLLEELAVDVVGLLAWGPSTGGTKGGGTYGGSGAPIGTTTGMRGMKGPFTVHVLPPQLHGRLV